MTDPDEDEPLHMVWRKQDAPSARGMTLADVLRDAITSLEAAIEMMPAETTAAGGPELLATYRRMLAEIEGLDGPDLTP